MITLDYVGKRVQMSHGPVTGFVMGLGQLNCSEIVLKEIRYRSVRLANAICVHQD